MSKVSKVMGNEAPQVPAPKDSWVTQLKRGKQQKAAPAKLPTADAGNK